MDVKKSIEKKRIIYNKSFWDCFWMLLLPVFLAILLLSSSFFVFESNYDKDYKENYWLILIGSISVFTVIIILIVFYFKIDNLTEFKGKSRTLNKKLVYQFVKEQGYEINYQTNDIIFIDIKVRFFGFSDSRKITVIFKGTSLLLNCTTFVNINNSTVYISNFKSPFYWFANKKHEKIFIKFLKKQ
jgi:hypothetical protein